MPKGERRIGGSIGGNMAAESVTQVPSGYEIPNQLTWVIRVSET
jgi:hypothetical protein